jgi:hypothetical protein
MRHKQLRIAATALVVLFISGHVAHTTNQTDGQSPRVLIEKNQIIEGSFFPETIPRPAEPPDETATSLPVRFDSALRSFERRRTKDAAFSAEVRVENALPVRDGGTTTRKTTYLIYRDSEGRTRRDLTSERTVTSVINDPVASSTYLIDHRSSVVRRLPLVTGNEVDSQPSVVQAKVRGMAPGFVNLDAQRSQVPKLVVSRAQVTQKEQLGQREIEGIITEGTRYVVTTSMGIEITTEEWYSVELQTIVAITVSDPRYGRSEYHLVNIVRGEPSKALFAIPQGYKVKE